MIFHDFFHGDVQQNKNGEGAKGGVCFRDSVCHVHLHSLGGTRVPRWTTCCGTLQSLVPFCTGRAIGWLCGLG